MNHSKKTLIAPLVTPLWNGKVDETSLLALIQSVESVADMLVACLSSGEGSKLSAAQWEQVVGFVCAHSKKPVYAGMLRKIRELPKYIQTAAELGCVGIVLPLGQFDETRAHEILTLAAQNNVKVIFYNSKSQAVTDIDYIIRLAAHPSVAGFKDSSMDNLFLQKLVAAKQNTHMSVYQGMEMAITKNAPHTDGYFISLVNVEPALCVQLAVQDSQFDWNHFQQIVQTYNLASDRWYITIKALLFARGTIRSAEEIHTL